MDNNIKAMTYVIAGVLIGLFGLLAFMPIALLGLCIAVYGAGQFPRKVH